MTTWLEANRLANLAAAQAHGDLGIDTSAPPIDVYRAIGDAGIVLMWRPMPRQFGAYIAEPASRPGILVNNGLPHGAQRQTAGHELGHHRLSHGTRFDADLDAAAAGRAAWTAEEKTAEAFAAWFLMPRKAVLGALAWLGLAQPRTAQEVYLLSLLLGTPYMSTVRHLPGLRLASPSQVREWAAVPLGTIKARLDQAAEAPASRKPDVWLIGPRLAGIDLIVHAGDRLVISCTGITEILDYPGWLRRTPVGSGVRRGGVSAGRWDGGRVDIPVVLEVRGQTDAEYGQVTVAAAHGEEPAEQWDFGVSVEGRRSGIARRWVS